MISEYHRPQTLEEALKLLSLPGRRPLGGGSILTHSAEESYAVVDLQALGLDKIHKSGNTMSIGATATLQAVLESQYPPSALKAGLKLEASLNLRNMGTMAGTLVICDGRSPVATVLLAMDARLTVFGEQSTAYGLGDFLLLRHDSLKNKLMTKIEIPLQIKSAFETVARSPTDKPIVCAALVQWTSGRTRLAIGGWGKAPTLAFDGNDASGIESAARNAAHDAADEWASSDYRTDVAAVLAKRCLTGILVDK
jgi:CO/xanthine dehydrogenase FAD-binding subunit